MSDKPKKYTIYVGYTGFEPSIYRGCTIVAVTNGVIAFRTSDNVERGASGQWEYEEEK